MRGIWLHFFLALPVLLDKYKDEPTNQMPTNTNTLTPRTDALMENGGIAINILEHARTLEVEVEELNSRIIAIKGTQSSLIAAINSAINEHKGSGASVYLDGIMENLFSK